MTSAHQQPFGGRGTGKSAGRQSCADGERVRSRKTESNLRWQTKNRAKYLAHKAVENAVVAGVLQRQPCVRCGATKSVHGHHDDYSMPLDVTWLCPAHHRERHAELAAAGDGPKVPDAASLRRRPPVEAVGSMAADYEAGLSLSMIVAKYRLKRKSNAHYLLKRHGVQMRDRGGKHRPTEPVAVGAAIGDPEGIQLSDHALAGVSEGGETRKSSGVPVVIHDLKQRASDDQARGEL